MKIYTGTEVVRVEAGKGTDSDCNRLVSGKTTDFFAENLLVVAGRRSNADLLAGRKEDRRRN
jgi:hypothetical protein